MATNITSPETSTTNRKTWTLDASHSSAEFSVRHLMIATVTGRFKDLQATVRADPDDLATAEIHATLAAASVDTGSPDRDAHLKSADFFDAENYPNLEFVGTRVENVANGSFRLVGELTIRDVTREVALDVEDGGSGTDPWGQKRRAFEATTSINRNDYGLKWNQALETGGVLVGDKVKIVLHLSFVEQA